MIRNHTRLDLTRQSGERLQITSIERFGAGDGQSDAVHHQRETGDQPSEHGFRSAAGPEKILCDDFQPVDRRTTLVRVIREQGRRVHGSKTDSEAETWAEL